MKESLLRKAVQSLEPYAVAPITVPTAINANESALNLWDVPEVREDLVKSLSAQALNHYPLPFADELRAAAAAYVNVAPEQVLLGNGGDEMIALLTQGFVEASDCILVHSPTFPMYEIDAEGMGARVVKVGDNGDFTHDVDGLLAAIEKEQPKILYLCNPNNPTGVLWDADELERLVAAAPGVVLVDEAYMEFAGEEHSFLPKLDTYPNAFVLRTLSKAFSLAACRVGYIVGSAQAISYVARVKPPYNLNVLSQTAGTVALRHADVMRRTVAEVVENRDYLAKALAALPGLTISESATNFLYVQMDNVTAVDQALREQGLLVKTYGKDAFGRGAMRITVTTREVCDRIIAGFKQGLEA